MSRSLMSVAALLAILPAAGCSSEAKAPPTELSPKFRAAIQRAHMAVHGDFPNQIPMGTPEATFNQAVAATEAVLREVGAAARSPIEENAHLVLANCFVKDRQRFQIAYRLREGMDPKVAMKEIAALKREHTQCSDEFSVWTGPNAPPASGANDGACLTEARKTR